MDLAQAASAVLTPLGFEVLEVRVTARGRTRKVLVRIDRLDESPVSVEDVELASEVFALELDRLDPIDAAFLLEVESPGAERPLRTARHFERFHDLLVKVRSSGETFTARIRTVEDDIVSFETPQGLRSIPLSAIDGAWLAEWPDAPR
jgi:ribosome maturation factor RimP